MPIISKQGELQLQLANLYENLQVNVQLKKTELSELRAWYNKACEMHIESGFLLENLWKHAERRYQRLFLDFDAHCLILEVISEYRNEEGNFTHLSDMHWTLNLWLERLKAEEAYEGCALIKHWREHLDAYQVSEPTC